MAKQESAHAVARNFSFGHLHSSSRIGPAVPSAAQHATSTTRTSHVKQVHPERQPTDRLGFHKDHKHLTFLNKPKQAGHDAASAPEPGSTPRDEPITDRLGFHKYHHHLTFLNREDRTPAASARGPSPKVPPRVMIAEKQVSEHDCPEFGAKYAMGKVLGKGSFGQVRRCKERGKVGKPVVCAVKVITTDRKDGSGEKSSRMVEMVRTEFDIQKSLDHPYVLAVHDLYSGCHNAYVVMDLCDGGDLYQAIAELDHFPVHGARVVFRKIADAVAYCHSKGVLHRDLKPANVLIRRRGKKAGESSSRSAEYEKFEPLLTDFGLAYRYTTYGIGSDTPADTKRRLSEVKKRTNFDGEGIVGSAAYFAPEIIRANAGENIPEGGYGAPCDVWALGVILFAMLHGYLPFDSPKGDEENMIVLFQRIIEGFEGISEEHWQSIPADCVGLLKGMFRSDPAKRLTSNEVLKHAFLAPESSAADEGATPYQVPSGLHALSVRARLRRAVRTVQSSVRLSMHRSSSSNAGSVAAAIEQEQEAREIFEQYDRDGDNSLSPDELETLLHDFGFPVTNFRLQRMDDYLNRADLNRDNRVDFEEFVHFYNTFLMEEILDSDDDL